MRSPFVDIADQKMVEAADITTAHAKWMMNRIDGQENLNNGAFTCSKDPLQLIRNEAYVDHLPKRTRKKTGRDVASKVT